FHVTGVQTCPLPISCRELGLLDEVLAQCPEHDDWSLPSNHSAIAAAFAVALAAQWRKITSLVVLLALLEGFSRVFIGVHYPHDVLLGFFVGGMVAAVVVWASGSIVRRRVLAARAPEEGQVTGAAGLRRPSARRARPGRGGTCAATAIGRPRRPGRCRHTPAAPT